jgi:hypothetical protein
MRRRLECRRLLQEKHRRLGAVEAVDATRAVDSQIRNSLEPTTAPPSWEANRLALVLRLGEPACLAGAFAGGSAGGDRAVPLVMAVTRVWTK